MIRKSNLYLATLLALILSSCAENKDAEVAEGENKETLFSLMAPEETGFQFFNKVENQKNFNIFKYRNFYNGGGVAIGDINNDGLADIYMTANMGPNKLFLNKGDMVFEDISAAAGVEGNKPWSTGVNMVDINNDGLLDIYVSNAGNLEGNNHDNDLYINNGDLTFTEQAAKYNLSETGFSTHATFFDYDKDGDLDAYILNNSNIPVSSLGYAHQRDVRAQDWEGVPYIFRGVGDMLLRNDGGTFTDVSEDAGIYGSLIGFGLGVMISDVNNDLYPDIYVSNDFYERDYLYINNQDGTFTEDIKGWTSHLCLSAMGVDFGDINNDGNADIFITDMLPEPEERVKSVMTFEGYNVFKLKQSKDFFQQYIQNTLQLNNGNGSFSEIAHFSGVARTDWSWAGLMFDMDNDGFRDIYVTNGINHDLTDLDFVDFFANDIIQKMALTGKKEAIDTIINKMPRVPLPNYAFHNQKDITFNNAAPDWGMDIPSMSNGCAYGDLDNDGDLDLVVNNVNMEAFLFRNNSEKVTGNHYLKLDFEGSDQNKFGIGSTVRLYFDGNHYMQELNPSRGFQSSMEYGMTIGLGTAKKIDSLRVIWPDNKTQLLTDVDPNQEITLKYGEATAVFEVSNKKKKQPTIFEEVEGLQLASHKENNYNDFDYEGLINAKVSQEGPSLAIGDIDGDGNEDVFIGGAAGQPGMIYRHLKDGEIKALPQLSFQNDASLEDTAAAFADIDNDGDQDLIVGSGGNQVGQQNTYVTRVYLNNGKGQFSKAPYDLPSRYKNISVIAPHDFDADGDVDLFIGSRSVVGTYGVNPDHLLLENRGDGNFYDVTERLAYDLNDAGMITDAQWADTDGDGKKDLVLVAEWGSPMILKNNGRRLVRTDSALNELTGWWNTIESADLDKDGDLDLIIGNRGSNIIYRPSKEQPMVLYINDFDNNGSIEQILTQRKDGKDYPIHMKKELTAQLVSLKKENLKASDYAQRAIDELFPEDLINNSMVKIINTSETIMAINEGDGNYRIENLPSRVQLSCVCGISAEDVNGDGHTDLIMAGNNFEFKPQFSRLDANYGNVLLGDGQMNFNWLNYNESGFFIRDEVKHVEVFHDKNGKSYLVAAINDNQPKIYRLNEVL
ncbi:CRTAC1 family protein [Robertkochia marina]|uniref:CRTAC1 family protein n=1 Tax=Robertkochia marina TaxID=1227945 RepID=A0A4S3M4X8_9FLAO|nr:VCBS repeat-containing protein [Robertkochia marina]THD69759.1 CRTAC1 family protein [Robertkochia marina]TRZ46898.1 CRTAC1 family protein [Robertkochia marina]